MSGVYGRMLAIPNRARSGALPTYQGNGQVYAPGAGVSARLSDAGGRLAGEAAQESARGLANLAKAADKAVQVGINAYEDYQVARAKDAFNKYQQEEMELRARLNTLKGQNALGDEGVEAQLGRWRTGARQRFAEELGTNSVASLMFGRAADRQDAETDAWAIGKVDRERTAYANGVDEAAIINATNKAMQDPMNHAAVGEAVGTIRATYESMARRNGWDASYRDAKFGEARQKMFGEMITNAIQAEDLGTARSLLRIHGAELGGLKGTLEARIQAKGRELASRARAEAERARAEAATNMVGQWLVETKGLAPEERAAELYSRLDGISDMKERAQMAGLVTSELAFEKKRDDAKTAAAVSQFAATVKAENLTPLEARSRLAASGISEEHQEYAMQKAYGEVRENATNRAALDEIRQSIDRKEITDKEQIERAGFNARMTDAQIKEAGKYLEQGGKLKTASISDVSRIYKRMTGKAEMPEGYYDAVISHLQDGKVPTEKELESIISNFEMQGKVQGDFFGSSLFESWRDDTAARWLPAISSSEERRELTSRLLALGLPNPTETDLRNYKKYRLMGIPFPYGPERQEDF